MLSSNCFFIFDFLGFFQSLYTWLKCVSFCKRSLFHHFFFLKFIHIIYRYSNWFKNTYSISLLIFISLSYNSLNSSNFFLILKGYSLSLEFCLFFVYCFSILSQYFYFKHFDVSNDSCLHLL